MKRFQVLGLCLLLALGAQAQEVYNSSGRSDYSLQHKKKGGFDKDRLIFGGGIDLSFGDITRFSFTPKVGYMFTDHFAAGIGLGYTYFSVKDFYEVPDLNGGYSYYDYKTNIYSASVWARYIVWNNLFVNAEYEHNFMTITDFEATPTGYNQIKDHFDAPSLLLGPGYRQPISDRASFTIMLLYDVIQDKYSPYYGSVFPTIGFNVGF